MKICIYLETGL